MWRIIVRREVSKGFDRITGEKIMSSFFVCPKNTNRESTHDAISEDSDELAGIIHQAELVEKAKEYKEKQKKVKLLVQEIQDLGYNVEIKEVRP